MAKEEKGYWFRAKRYGWGWGTPLTWQGWVSFGIFVLVWLIALYVLIPVDGSDMPVSNLTVFLTVMVLDIIGLMYVSFKYGEPPSWNWGKKHGKRSKADKSEPN